MFYFESPTDNYHQEIANNLISRDLLAENQSSFLIEMIRDIVQQVKANPHQLPNTIQTRRNIEKVRHASLTRQRNVFRTHQRHRSREETSTSPRWYDLWRPILINLSRFSLFKNIRISRLNLLL